MWVAGLLLLFLILILVDARQLLKRRNKTELTLYVSLITAAFFLSIINKLHILPDELFSPIKIVTKVVQILAPGI